MVMAFEDKGIFYGKINEKYFAQVEVGQKYFARDVELK